MIVDFLNSIGSTAEEVAEYIASKGAVGRPRISWWCPVAEMLRKEFPLLTIDGINGDHICYHASDGYHKDKTPPNIKDFMRRFDKDEFLNLRKCFRHD